MPKVRKISVIFGKLQNIVALPAMMIGPKREKTGKVPELPFSS